MAAFNNDWLSHKNSNGSSISVSQSARKNAANSGRFELEPSSSRPTLHCCFFSFLLKLLYPAPILPCLSEPSLPLLGPETHSLQACLSLCPSSNRVLSVSIALDTHLFFLILRVEPIWHRAKSYDLTVLARSQGHQFEPCLPRIRQWPDEIWKQHPFELS